MNKTIEETIDEVNQWLDNLEPTTLDDFQEEIPELLGRFETLIRQDERAKVIKEIANILIDPGDRMFDGRFEIKPRDLLNLDTSQNT